MYAQIKDNKIIRGPKNLPRNYKNITRFDLMPDSELKKHGWVPVIGFSVNRSTEVRGEPTIYDDRVEYGKTKKTIDEIKEENVNKFKPIAAKELTATDWKVVRHMEQLANGVTTSLTGAEYSQLLKDRQATRDKSNDKESEIMSSDTDTFEKIKAVKWNDDEELII